MGVVVTRVSHSVRSELSTETAAGALPLRPPGGGRMRWAHLEFTRMNIEPTMVKKDIEDSLQAAPKDGTMQIRRGYLDLRSFHGRMISVCRRRFEDPQLGGYLAVTKRSFARGSPSVHRPDRWGERSRAAPQFH
jgi:hypothetical protein